MLTGAVSRFTVRFGSGFRRNRNFLKLVSTMSSSSSVKKGVKKAQNLKCAASNDVVEGTGRRRGVMEEQRVEIDWRKIDLMTVNELRTTLRGFGMPAQGLKQDLVAALKVFLDKMQHANGDGLTITEWSSTDEMGREGSTRPSKRNMSQSQETDADQVVHSSTEVSEVKRYRRRVKKPMVKEIDTVETKEILSTKQQILEVPDQTEPWTIFAHKRPKPEWVAYNPATMRPPPPPTNGTKTMKLLSWNVNGLRALLKMEGISKLAQMEDFDVLCLQETKLQEKDVKVIKQTLVEGYDNSFWTCSVAKLGYSGTAIISRVKPISVTYGLGISDHDNEGRIVTAEFDSFYLISAYVPNSGDGLRRLSYRIEQWDPSLSSHLKELEKSKPVILTGDLNCAHQEIDIYNPAGNKRSAGFTDEERQSFETNFLHNGFVDTFRNQHPGVVGYSYWGYRHGGRKSNKGWRLDYFLVSESIADKVHDSYILPSVGGSDHSPVGVILKL